MFKRKQVSFKETFDHSVSEGSSSFERYLPSGSSNNLPPSKSDDYEDIIGRYNLSEETNGIGRTGGSSTYSSSVEEETDSGGDLEGIMDEIDAPRVNFQESKDSSRSSSDQLNSLSNLIDALDEVNTGDHDITPATVTNSTESEEEDHKDVLGSWLSQFQSDPHVSYDQPNSIAYNVPLDDETSTSSPIVNQSNAPTELYSNKVTDLRSGGGWNMRRSTPSDRAIESELSFLGKLGKSLRFGGKREEEPEEEPEEEEFGLGSEEVVVAIQTPAPEEDVQVKRKRCGCSWRTIAIIAVIVLLVVITLGLIVALGQGGGGGTPTPDKVIAYFTSNDISDKPTNHISNTTTDSITDQPTDRTADFTPNHPDNLSIHSSTNFTSKTDFTPNHPNNSTTDCTPNRPNNSTTNPTSN